MSKILRAIVHRATGCWPFYRYWLKVAPGPHKIRQCAVCGRSHWNWYYDGWQEDFPYHTPKPETKTAETQRA